MSETINAKIRTLYEDAAGTIPLFPRSKVKAITDDDGKALSNLLDDMNKNIDTVLSQCITTYTQSAGTLTGTGENGKFKATTTGTYTSFTINGVSYAVKAGDDTEVELTSGAWYNFILDSSAKTINFKLGGLSKAKLLDAMQYSGLGLTSDMSAKEILNKISQTYPAYLDMTNVKWSVGGINHGSKGVVTIKDGIFKLKGSGGKYDTGDAQVSYCQSALVDITNMNTLRLVGNAYHPSVYVTEGGATTPIGYLYNKSGSLIKTLFGYRKVGTTNMDLTIDVSNLIGSHYIRFELRQAGYGYSGWGNITLQEFKFYA